nr:mannosylglycoprotein endo-beta-mannosidase [Quercus suber]
MRQLSPPALISNRKITLLYLAIDGMAPIDGALEFDFPLIANTMEQSGPLLVVVHLRCWLIGGVVVREKLRAILIVPWVEGCSRSTDSLSLSMVVIGYYMNFNMICYWGGGLAERPEYYHYCDIYGRCGKSFGELKTLKW